MQARAIHSFPLLPVTGIATMKLSALALLAVIPAASAFSPAVSGREF